MTNDFPQERLGRLRADANQSIGRFARNRLAVTLLSLRPGSGERHRTAASAVSTPLRPAGRPIESGLLDVEASASGVTIDEERRVRAMVKDIKRLIVEDRRRGLGVGG